MAEAEPATAGRNAISELLRVAEVFRVSLPADAPDRFSKYIETLLLWRSRLALTGATTADTIVRRHIADAFAVVRFIQPSDRVADLGSGAGFPGIPLAIACPGTSFDLVDSRRKRANFLREVVRAAGLANVTVIEERADALVQHSPGIYDLTVSRAVWRGAQFFALSSVLLRPGGSAIAMKGPRSSTEPEATPAGFSAPDLVLYQLENAVARSLVVCRRAGDTPPRSHQCFT